jgi:hypothetical protein
MKTTAKTKGITELNLATHSYSGYRVIRQRNRYLFRVYISAAASPGNRLTFEARMDLALKKAKGKLLMLDAEIGNPRSWKGKSITQALTRRLGAYGITVTPPRN